MTALGEHGTTQGGGPALKQITKIFLIICILGSYSEEVWSKTHDYSLVPSVGAKSSKGYFGLEAAYFPKSSYDVHLGFGRGETPKVSVGSRFYAPRERCLSFPACRYFLYAGGDLSASLPGNTTYQDELGRKGQYKLGMMGFAHAEIGIRGVIADTLVTDFAIGYQALLNRDIEKRTNTLDSDAVEEEFSNGASVRFGLGFGF